MRKSKPQRDTEIMLKIKAKWRIPDIAKHYNLTRQAVYNIIKKIGKLSTV